MPTYQAIINMPGEKSRQGTIPTFESAWKAWHHLMAGRESDLEDPVNDAADLVEDDQALDEMDAYAQTNAVGTVHGFTPGHHGDQDDLGLNYTVVRTELGPKDKGTQHFMACASMPANQPGWEI